MCMQYSSRDAKPQTMKSISVGLVDIEDINPKSSGEKWPEISVTCKEVVGIQEQRVTMSW